MPVTSLFLGIRQLQRLGNEVCVPKIMGPNPKSIPLEYALWSGRSRTLSQAFCFNEGLKYIKLRMSKRTCAAFWAVLVVES